MDYSQIPETLTLRFCFPEVGGRFLRTPSFIEGKYNI